MKGGNYRLVGGSVVVGCVVGTGILYLFGWRAFALQSNSMSPTCPVGSIAITRRGISYQPGDVVTYTAPTKPRKLVTHRITTQLTLQGMELVRTKGDHNPNGDPWYVPKSTIIGKVVTCIKGVGYTTMLSTSMAGFMLAVVVSALFLIMLIP